MDTVAHFYQYFRNLQKTTCQSVCTCRKGQKFQTADNAVRTYDTSQIGILNLYLPPNNDGVCVSDGITKP
ncbi:hypothetical protein EPM78_04685 [Neisseria gonorrhoeae]|uniref:Uncharacterized protein n=1 Tax=Neisseria gonorrhoeae TaxID=485 RepID=A0AAX2TPE7_NEIGO|nr:hypothetical protein A6J43_01865 [Neisseria gonorrhoeae]ARC02409.1 hypothetical protein A6J44_13080 [Neisseria gonorrhoeae]ARC03176.1 hypothetical protein A6J46_04925 [Neisseria gonorrhoeae]ASQ72612.1 hypothetical protein BZG33_08970 [Neisseria gonorrhoeae]ASQ74927.1 hypothetical protein BZG34_08995 [Neisseria gonorrhoeae]